MTVGPFPIEWVDAAARALVREQTMGACDESWPRRCAMCDCFRGDTTAAYERQQMQAVLEVVVPLIRADETRRIAEDLRAQAAYSRRQGLTRSAAYFDAASDFVAARVAHEGNAE